MPTLQGALVRTLYKALCPLLIWPYDSLQVTFTEAQPKFKQLLLGCGKAGHVLVPVANLSLPIRSKYPK